VRVLITGATGFVGGWTAAAIAEQGHELRFLVRSPDKLRRTADFFGFNGDDHVVGDITDPTSTASALQGCDAVVHTAAEVVLQHTDDADDDAMVARNVAGTRNIVGGAVDAGIGAIVHVSSSVVLWSKTRPILDGESPLTGGAGAYGRSKTAVEKYVRDLQDRGAPIAITYPCGVMGPAAAGHLGESGDGLFSLADAGVLGRTGGLTVVDVRDLADLHTRLIEPGHGPRRVAAGGHRLTGRALARAMSAASGRRVHYIPIPNTALVGLGRLADRFRNLVPASLEQLSETAVDYLLYPPDPDNSTAEALGVTFRPISETFEAVFASRNDRNTQEA